MSDLRGQCEEMSKLEVDKDPTLRLVRGYYHCPVWGRQEHWWCERQDGSILDVTAEQFPSKGVFGEYEEYTGVLYCTQCDQEVKEEDSYADGHHIFCSDYCFRRCIGF